MAFKSPFGSSQQKKDKKESQPTTDLRTDPAKIHDASFLDAVVKVYCTHTAPDYSLPWQKQRQFTSTGSAFMIGDGKLLTNAHCVEHDTQVYFPLLFYLLLLLNFLSSFIRLKLREEEMIESTWLRFW